MNIERLTFEGGFRPGELNVTYHPLASRKGIIASSLHIKLGIMKDYVKAPNKDVKCYKHIIKMFPKLNS